MVTVNIGSGQAVLPAVPVSARVPGNDLSVDSALVAASIVHDKLGEHGSPEGIELSHNLVAVSNKMGSIAAGHGSNPEVLVVAASVVMSEHFVELRPVSVLGLNNN